jgi:hypothetical protein
MTLLHYHVCPYIYHSTDFADADVGVAILAQLRETLLQNDLRQSGIL